MKGSSFQKITQIVIQLRCDGDPRILCAIPHRFPFLRFAWLPYAVPSPQGRLLISGATVYTQVDR
ncbi:MAG: hypothetical protein HC768_20975 [Acaryochloris sp. CRU_2_0]|nr:hypothetical protein [Acaryochloris sp. CRU_2_0]